MNEKLAYGIHAVNSLLKNNTLKVLAIYVQPSPNKRHQDILANFGAKVITKSTNELDSITKNASHQGIVLVYEELKPLTESLGDLLKEKTEDLLLLILDGVVDPHNLGSCLRSAAAFGVDGVIIPKDNAVGVTETVMKVAAGAANLVPVFSVTNLSRTMEKLAKHGVWLYGLSEHADQHLASHSLTGNIAIVMGSEAKGIRELTAKKCDYLVSLPTSKVFSTLNVSVATGIALYEVKKNPSK